VPAWRLSRTAPGDALKSTAGSLSPWRWARLHAGEGFVVIQMSLALVLLIGAGLMIRSLQQLADVSPGFQPQHVLTAETAAPASLARDNPLALAPHFESLLEAARQVPGVDAAAIGTSIPFTWSVSTMVFYRDDRPVPTDGQFPHGNSHFVTADYFKVLGIPLQRGRLLTGREPQPPLQPGTALSPENFSQVYQGLVLDCVISQSMADRYWPQEDPLGKQFRLGYPHMRMPPARIVGVGGSTVQEGLDRERPEEFYLSLRQMPFPFGVHVVVRTHGEPSSLIPMLRSALEAASKNEPVHDIQPLQSRIDASVSDRRFTAQLFGAFSAVALALACVGIHGVLSFIVGQRTREVGVRMALGAPRSCILRQVVARGLRLVVVGSVLGLAAAWAFARFLQHQLFGVGTLDPWSYTLSASLLLAGALLASFLPAHRAARLDPVRALRTE
jgi:predicted permease